MLTVLTPVFVVRGSSGIMSGVQGLPSECGVGSHSHVVLASTCLSQPFQVSTGPKSLGRFMILRVHVEFSVCSSVCWPSALISNAAAASQVQTPSRSLLKNSWGLGAQIAQQDPLSLVQLYIFPTTTSQRRPR